MLGKTASETAVPFNWRGKIVCECRRRRFSLPLDRYANEEPYFAPWRAVRLECLQSRRVPTRRTRTRCISLAFSPEGAGLFLPAVNDGDETMELRIAKFFLLGGATLFVLAILVVFVL
jgi:hypothetical protein